MNNFNYNRNKRIYFNCFCAKLFISITILNSFVSFCINAQQASLIKTNQYANNFGEIRKKYFQNAYAENLKSKIFYGNIKASVCYFDSKSHLREGDAKFEVPHLVPALQYCTHLIYGYATINGENFKLIPLNENFDVIKDNYRKVTDLKQQYPNLKILLSVGGDADILENENEDNLKYRTLLESSTTRLSFINSAYTLIKGFGFDGIDLAWEFPKNKPKKIRGAIGSLWHSLKKKVGAIGDIDDKAKDHQEQFSALVRELKNAFNPENLLVSLTVLPNVNSSVYYNPQAISPHVDLVNLLAFDFHTPERNPKEADYPAPLYELIDRRLDENLDNQVKYWLMHGGQAHKLVVGIPTYGRAWKMYDESDINGMPPLLVNGPADAGPQTKQPGLLSYPEICTLLKHEQHMKDILQKTIPINVPHENIAKGINTNGLQMKRINDMKKGTLAYKLADENNNGGIWIGYDDPEAIKHKVSYIKAKGLGGVAIKDLTLDDFRGTCNNNGNKFSLLKTAVENL